MNDQSYQRCSRKKVITALQDTPVILIMGPRQSGKTTLLRSLIDYHGNTSH